MSKKLTITQWLNELGVDTSRPVDIFKASGTLGKAYDELDSKCKHIMTAYSLKVLEGRGRNNE